MSSSKRVNILESSPGGMRKKWHSLLAGTSLAAASLAGAWLAGASLAVASLARVSRYHWLAFDKPEVDELH